MCGPALGIGSTHSTEDEDIVAYNNTSDKAST